MRRLFKITISVGILFSLWCVIIYLRTDYMTYPTSSSSLKETEMDSSPFYVFPLQCNTSLFNKELDLDSSTALVPRELLADCRRVLYNRVPKCASRTTLAVFESLAEPNNFTHIFVDKEWKFKNGTLEKLYLEPMSASHASVLTSHFLYYDFQKFYPDCHVYINIIREPVSWFQSVFYWKKYGSPVNPHSPDKHPNLKTMDKCVLDERCTHGIRATFGAYHFICGQDTICRDVNETSIIQAVENVENKYILVGIYEDLPAFFEVLEYLMPHMFTGIQDKYREMSLEQLNSTKTLSKKDPSEHTEVYLRTILAKESLFYNMVKERFYKILDAVRRSKQMT